MNDTPNDTPRNDPARAADTLEGHWRPKFEAAAARDTDAERNIGHSFGHRERLRVFRDLVQLHLPPHAASVLDVGCGSGTYFELYGSLHLDILGIDYSPAQIEKARRRNPEARLFAGRVEDAPPEFRADLVVCIGVVQVVSELVPFLHELCLRVRPGGTAVVSCLNARSVWPGAIWEKHLRFFRLSAISSLLNRDFRIADMRRFYPLPGPFELGRPLLYRLQAPLLNHGFMFVLKPR